MAIPSAKQASSPSSRSNQPHRLHLSHHHRLLLAQHQILLHRSRTQDLKSHLYPRKPPCRWQHLITIPPYRALHLAKHCLLTHRPAHGQTTSIGIVYLQLLPWHLSRRKRNRHHLRLSECHQTRASGSLRYMNLLAKVKVIWSFEKVTESKSSRRLTAPMIGGRESSEVCKEAFQRTTVRLLSENLLREIRVMMPNTF